MKRLLTIAVPTYNRADLLDKQLAWFAEAVKGKEQCCELIVTDNCSTDATPAVMEKWGQVFRDTPLLVHMNRNAENLGAIRNIAYGISKARGQFVWTVSDDDGVAPNALHFVLEKVESHPDLTLLILNFSSRHWRTRKLKYARCFEVDEERVESCGTVIFEEALADPNPSRWGGLALTTALIYRTEVAQAALREWVAGLDNLTCQLYITAFCAMQGETILTRDAHVEMAGGRHFFTKDRQMYLRFKIAEIPEAFIKIAELGYSRELCEQKIVNQREELKMRLLLQNIRRGPFKTIAVLSRYRASLKRIRVCGGDCAGKGKAGFPVAKADDTKRVAETGRVGS